MSLDNKGKISLLIFIIFLASIIPYCMISSYRESIVQNRIQAISITHQENALGLNKIFNSSNNQQISLTKKGEKRE